MREIDDDAKSGKVRSMSCNEMRKSYFIENAWDEEADLFISVTNSLPSALSP